MTLHDDLAAMNINHHDDVAIALAPTLSPRRAAFVARRIARCLDDAKTPGDQRTWIIAAGADDDVAARLSAAIADAVADAVLTIHDPGEPDGLIFQRRIPGQRRGGVYLNQHWQQASCRIVVGDAELVAVGLSAWFNGRGQVCADDLQADLVID